MTRAAPQPPAPPVPPAPVVPPVPPALPVPPDAYPGERGASDDVEVRETLGSSHLREALWRMHTALSANTELPEERPVESGLLVAPQLATPASLGDEPRLWLALRSQEGAPGHSARSGRLWRSPQAA